MISCPNGNTAWPHRLKEMCMNIATLDIFLVYKAGKCSIKKSETSGEIQFPHICPAISSSPVNYGPSWAVGVPNYRRCSQNPYLEAHHVQVSQHEGLWIRQCDSGFILGNRQHWPYSTVNLHPRKDCLVLGKSFQEGGAAGKVHSPLRLQQFPPS